MRQYLVIAALAGTLLSNPAVADDAQPAMISVTGQAQISVPPDLALIDGGVSTEAKTARQASEANNVAMGKVLLALKGAGFGEKDVQTSRLSLEPQYVEQTRPGPNVISGYRASNRVIIKLRDVSKVAGTIDTLVASGANEIGGISFMVEKASKLLDDARAEAVADARRRAEIYASAAGVTLGAPLRISETSSGGSPMPMMARKMAASAPVAQGEETLQVNVSVSWAIKPTQQ